MSEVAAWVGERAITVAEVEQRLAVLRAGPYAARLPHPDTAEGRNLRRWLVQAMATEAVIAEEAARLGVRPEDAPADGSDPNALEGMAGAVLATTPLARALRRRVAPEEPVPEDRLRAYHERNRDRYPAPYPEAARDIAAVLSAADRDRRFSLWLQGRQRDLVRLAPGFEHPGDPRHPDAVHRH